MVWISSASIWEIAIKAALGLYHSDPFDRILIAQAQCESLT
jgi:PIN domain nuclease of toxin-antitoxin system